MNHDTFERIATALESIAESLKQSRKPSGGLNTRRSAEFLEALRAHADELKGRMSLQEIAFTIDMEVGRGDQLHIGAALTEYGAHKGKSGPARYYLFP